MVYDRYGGTPVVREVPAPACPSDGVVVRVGATGVCRSDWHAWQGHDPVPLPMVPGHELAGTVVSAGPEVARWGPGDRVTVPFACGCGRCEQCAAGDTHVCPRQTQPGFTGWGSFAELVALEAADTNLVALPDDLGFAEAASLGCRFATAHRALLAQGRLVGGEWLAVHGCGGVGLSAVLLGVALGAHVVAVDVSHGALEAARALGAEVVVRASSDPDGVGAAVREASGGGAHLALDAFGSVPSMHASIASLRPRGRHVQVGLLLADAADAPVPMARVVAQELELLGAHGMPARDYPGLLGLVASGRVDPRRLVGQVVGLAEAPAALAAMSGPTAGAGITVVDPRR